MGRGEGDKQTDRDRAAVGDEGRRGVRHSTQLSSSSSSSPRYLLPPFVRAQVHPTSFGRRTTAGSLFCAPPFRWVRGRLEHRFAEKNGVLRCPAGNAIRFPLTGKCMRTLGNCCNAAPYLAVAQFHLNKRHSPSLHFLSLLLKYLLVLPAVRCAHLSHMLFDWATRTPCLRTVGRVDLT